MKPNSLSIYKMKLKNVKYEMCLSISEATSKPRSKPEEADVVWSDHESIIISSRRILPISFNR